MQQRRDLVQAHGSIAGRETGTLCVRLSRRFNCGHAHLRETLGSIADRSGSAARNQPRHQRNKIEMLYGRIGIFGLPIIEVIPHGHGTGGLSDSENGTRGAVFSRNGWYRRFIRDFSTMAAPIIDLVKKGNTKIKWTAEGNIAFDILKNCLTTQPRGFISPSSPIMHRCVGCCLSKIPPTDSRVGH